MSTAADSPPPKYRRRRPPGPAVVTLNGKDYHPGKWNAKAGRTEYDRLIGEWLSGGRCLQPGAGDTDLTAAAEVMRKMGESIQ